MRLAIFQTLLSQRTLLTRLRAHTSSLQKELDELHGILDDLTKGYNPNYQDMAVKAAVVGYEELTRIPATTGEGEEVINAEERQDDIAKEDVVEKVSEWELDQAEQKDLEGLLLEDMNVGPGAEDGEDASTGLCKFLFLCLGRIS